MRLEASVPADALSQVRVGHAGGLHGERLSEPHVHRPHHAHQSRRRSRDATGADHRVDPERRQHAGRRAVRRRTRGERGAHGADRAGRARSTSAACARTSMRIKNGQDREGRSAARHPRRGDRDGRDHERRRAGRHDAARRGARHLAGHAGAGQRRTAGYGVGNSEPSGCRIRPTARSPSQRAPERQSQSPMFISDFAIKRPLITVVSMVALVVFGLFALLKLKTDEFPDVAPPVVTVGILYPGASPDGVEKESPRSGRGADLLDQRREARHGQGVRRLRLHHRRVPVRQGPEARRRRTCATRSRRCAPTCRSR